MSVAVAWSVESLPSNPEALVIFPAGSEILISILGLVVCPVLSLAVVLALCCLHIRGSPPLCICIEF